MRPTPHAVLPKLIRQIPRQPGRATEDVDTYASAGRVCCAVGSCRCACVSCARLANGGRGSEAQTVGVSHVGRSARSLDSPHGRGLGAATAGKQASKRSGAAAAMQRLPIAGAILSCRASNVWRRATCRQAGMNEQKQARTANGRRPCNARSHWWLRRCRAPVTCVARQRRALMGMGWQTTNRVRHSTDRSKRQHTGDAKGCLQVGGCWLQHRQGRCG